MKMPIFPHIEGDGKISNELVKRYTEMGGKVRCIVPTTYDCLRPSKIKEEGE